jgi:hypothetical protein
MPDLDRETERRLAAGLYNEVWRLMELPKRKRSSSESGHQPGAA